MGTDEPSWQERADRLHDKIEDIQDRLRDLEITLHGKRAKTGLLAEYFRHDELLGRLYAVIWQDPTGQKGILHDIDVLMGRARAREENKAIKWQSGSAIAVAIIMSLASLMINLDKIKKYLPKYHPGPLEQKIDQARRPRGKVLYKTRKVSASEEPSESTKESPASQ